MKQPESAAVLLRHFNWKKEKLIEVSHNYTHYTRSKGELIEGRE